jgi:hypothetical protein
MVFHFVDLCLIFLAYQMMSAHSLTFLTHLFPNFMKSGFYTHHCVDATFSPFCCDLSKKKKTHQIENHLLISYVLDLSETFDVVS